MKRCTVSWPVVTMTRRHLRKSFDPEQKPGSSRMIQRFEFSGQTRSNLLA